MNRHLWQIALYAGLGFVLDFIITLYYRFIMRRQAMLASLSGMLVTALNLYVISEVIVSKNYTLALAFIVGQGAGTFVAMKIGDTE